MPKNRFRRNMLVSIVVSFNLDNSTVKVREKDKQTKHKRLKVTVQLYSSNPILYLNMVKNHLIVIN